MNEQELLDRIAQLEGREAVIAIENARLFNELEASNREVSEALEQQTAMAEVLAVIAASPADLDTVLPELAAAAAKLCQADSVVITHGSNEVRRVWKTGLGHFTLQGRPSEDPADRVPGGVAFSTNRPVLLSGPIDSWAAEFPRTAEEFRDAGVTECCLLAVPLRGAEGPVGAVVVRRHNAVPFTDRHVAIVETFASQAVIAIENARLFNELQESNANLTATIEEQKATGEVLEVISRSPTDLQRVLDDIVERAARLLDSYFAVIQQLVDGELMGVTVISNGQPGKGTLALPMRRSGFVGFPSEVAVRERRTVHTFGGPDAVEDLPQRRALRFRQARLAAEALDVAIRLPGIELPDVDQLVPLRLHEANAELLIRCRRRRLTEEPAD